MNHQIFNLSLPVFAVNLTLEQANNLGLVLSAAQIAYRAVAYHDRWSLWVDEDDQVDAGMALYTYEQENETDADEEILDQEPWGQSHPQLGGCLGGPVFGGVPFRRDPFRQDRWDYSGL